MEVVGTSDAVPISTVLGDEPIVVTPSPSGAWHGIVMRISPFRVSPLARQKPHTLGRFTHAHYIITYATDIKSIV